MTPGKRILVTGGIGHVGAAVVRVLRAQGYEVWTADRGHHEDPSHLRCDVREFRQCARMFDDTRFDLVYHAAAEFGRRNGEDFYENLWLTNVVGTKNMLRLQERHRFRLIFFSTSEVYGDYEGVMAESVMDRLEIRQLNDYAISKWVGELQVVNSAQQEHTETVRVRLFNIYGPGERYSPYRSALCRFCYHALRSMPYTVYEGHSRSWLYIDDAARTLAALAERFTPGEAYNIGSTESLSMRALSDLVLAAVGRDDSLVRYEPQEPFTTREKRVDISKAVEHLGHEVTVRTAEGVTRTIEWMRSYYGP